MATPFNLLRIDTTGMNWIAFSKPPNSAKLVCYGFQDENPNTLVSGDCPTNAETLPNFNFTSLNPLVAEQDSIPSAIAITPSISSLPGPRTASFTTASGTNSSTSASAVRPVNRGLSSGTVAGIAIGVFLIGVLAAGTAFFLLSRRQKRRQSPLLDHHRPPRNISSTLQEKGAVVVASPLASSIDDLIAQPVADDTITGEASRIRDNVKNHARTYYHSVAMTASSINAPGLQTLATVTGVSASVLAAALADPMTRQNAIRLVLGWCVLSKCTGERHPSLLSAELSSFAISIQGADENDSSKLNVMDVKISIDADRLLIATSRLYSKWKAITGALMQQRFGKNPHESSRAEIFTATIAEIDAVLAPFVQGSVDGGQRRKNLDMILTRAANFAFLLFSQPGSFRFDFASGHGGLVAFPALVQIVGDQGQVLRPARVLLDKEVAA
ncbi:hypothetical protein J1614_009814 [Plenodomus biglobosus]|nr:hypothetical protein J1614_009814 [Plenodomus biglobosus]